MALGLFSPIPSSRKPDEMMVEPEPKTGQAETKAQGPLLRPEWRSLLNGPLPQGGPTEAPGWLTNSQSGHAFWTGSGLPTPTPIGFQSVAREGEEPDAYDLDQLVDEGYLPEKQRKVERYSGGQLEIVARPGTHGRPTLGDTGMYGKYGERIGEKIFSKTLDPNDKKNFGSAYRMAQIHYASQMGGAGLDEMFSTATTRQFLADQIDKSGDYDEAIKSMARIASSSREDVTNLLWTTGLPATPISGHPGNLTSVPGNMHHGVTKGHSGRDAIRAKWAKAQLNDGGRNKDLEGGIRMAEVMTNQLMSQPYAQLSQVKKGKISNVYHAQYGDLSVGSKWHSAMAKSHNKRENRKSKLAHWMMTNGHQDLVAPEMQKALQDAGGAHNLNRLLGLRYTGTSDDGPAESLAHVPRKEDTPKTFAEMKQLGLRAVSPPRRRIVADVKKPTSAQKRFKQKTLLEMGF